MEVRGAIGIIMGRISFLVAVVVGLVVVCREKALLCLGVEFLSEGDREAGGMQVCFLDCVARMDDGLAVGWCRV